MTPPPLYCLRCVLVGPECYTFVPAHSFAERLPSCPPRRVQKSGIFLETNCRTGRSARFASIPAEGRVLRDGRPVPLTPKAFDLLVSCAPPRPSCHARSAALETVARHVRRRIQPDRGDLGGSQGARARRAVDRDRAKNGYRFVGPAEEAGLTVEPESRLTGPGRLPRLRCSRSSTSQADPEQEYFVEGMTEALIADLAQISALRVISRTTTMRYKGTRTPLPQIARELKVDGVIEGSVLRVGDRVRITAQLIHAATDTHVWAQHYERPLDDVLAVHGEVARAVAREIQVRLTPDEGQRLARSTRHVSRGPRGLPAGSPSLAEVHPGRVREGPATIFIGRLRWIRRSRERMPRSRTCTLRLVRMG